MNKKNILLISANKHVIPYPVYPIGISYITTYLKSKLPDHLIKGIDLNFYNYSELKNTITEFKPSLIGISFRNVDDVNLYNQESFIESYKNLIKEIRKQSDAKIVIGGSGYSIFPELLYKELDPDYAIYGEGEESFYKLVINSSKKANLGDIEGLVFQNNGKICINSRSNYIQDLNLDFDENLIDFYWKNSGMLNIQTKRGCPYKCIYCTYPLIEGKKVRTLNTDKIVNNLKELYHKRGINYIFFTDSVFNIQNDYNYKLAEKIIKSKMNIKWGAYFTFNNLDEKLLVKLKQAGLTHIEFGTESISDEALEKYGKHFRVSDVLEKSNLCNKLDIDYAHFLILAGYGETDATVNETYENSKKMGRTVFFPFVGMRIYPETELYKHALDEGVIDENDNLLKPQYYVSEKVNLDTLKERAKATKRNWVFPDEDTSEIVNKLRLKRNKKGPLWEYLIS